MKTDADHGGPSVDSDDRDERIAARRLRIEQRKEAQKRAVMGADVAELENVKEEMSVSRKQMEDSYIRLKKLHEDGFEMVTNVRVAGDAREASRRVEEDESQRQRKEKIEAEAKAGAERFDDITKKWEVALQKELAQDLFEMLTMQKQACDSMLDEKNKLINDCQTELKSKDDQYVKALKKQAEDIDLLIERMDNQVKELTIAYRTELEQIESSFVQERSTMLNEMDAKWHQMLKDRRQKEIDYMKRREEQVEDYEQQLHQVRVQDAEEYNQIKVKLETDVQLLQQNLQQMKATYQLNQEKLEYNFQVLRKRDEENTITKSLQKRKITRLHDVLMSYKRKLVKQEKLFLTENIQMVEDYKHVTEQYKSLLKKSKHFVDMDTERFRDIWLMNEEECKKLSLKMVDMDQIIHEQQLGLNWMPPDMEFMSNVGPLVPDTSSEEQTAQDLAKKLMLSTGSGPEAPIQRTSTYYRDYFTRSDPDLEDKVSQAPTEHSSTYYRDYFLSKTDLVEEESIEEKFPLPLVKQILELLCDESGFLLEEKVRTLLSPLERCEQTLMKLDAIFNVMNIESEEDIQRMARYFMKFRGSDSSRHDLDSSAAHVQDKKHEEEEEDEETVSSEVEIIEKRSDPFASKDSSIPSLLDLKGMKEVNFFDEEEQADKDKGIDPYSTGEQVDERKTMSDLSEACSSNEELKESGVLIHPNDVVKALRSFIEDSKKQVGSEDDVEMEHVSNHLLANISSKAPSTPPAATAGKGDGGDRASSRAKNDLQFILTGNLAFLPADSFYNIKEPVLETEDVLEKYQLDKIVNEMQFNVNQRNDENDAEYWAKYMQVISNDKLKVWDALIENFEKYYVVLTSRSKLLDERDTLRQQNTELRILLEQYVNSKVNQDLQVPPTKVMQLSSGNATRM